jgi:hypothetical protein
LSKLLFALTNKFKEGLIYCRLGPLFISDYYFSARLLEFRLEEPVPLIDPDFAWPELALAKEVRLLLLLLFADGTVPDSPLALLDVTLFGLL